MITKEMLHGDLLKAIEENKVEEYLQHSSISYYELYNKVLDNSIENFVEGYEFGGNLPICYDRIISPNYEPTYKQPCLELWYDIKDGKQVPVYQVYYGYGGSIDDMNFYGFDLAFKEFLDRMKKLVEFIKVEFKEWLYY